MTYKRREYSSYPVEYEKISKMDRFAVTVSIISTSESIVTSSEKHEKMQRETKAAEERRKARELQSLEEYEERENE